MIKRLFVLVVATGAFAFGGLTDLQAQAPAKPKLVLVLSIDQMRFDYLTRFNDSLQRRPAQTARPGSRVHQCQVSSCEHRDRTRPFRHSLGTACVAFRHCGQLMVRPAPQEEHQRC